jgi:hypothetical protein
VESNERELPGVREIGCALADAARARPWTATGVALLAGYLLGGGLFTRPTRWLLRAAIGALAVPRFRQQAVALVRRVRPAERGPSRIVVAPF